MKMILLMYLEDDEPAVDRILERHDVTAFSRVNLEGHGSGQPVGWYGEVAPYRSRMVFTLVPEERAAALLDAVGRCTDCLHPKHPIHAVMLHVEKAVDSGATASETPA
jgi:hypothetical protein